MQPKIESLTGDVVDTNPVHHIFVLSDTKDREREGTI